MATCPECQLPNPDTADACIWCGRHQFRVEAAPAEAVAEVAPAEVVAEVVLNGVTAGPIVLSPSLLGVFAEPILTPSTPPPEQKPLPSHVNLLFGPPPGSSGETTPRTPNTTPTGSWAERSAPAVLAAGNPPASAITLRATTPPPPPAIRPKLIVLRGQKPDREFPVYEGRNIVGRFADKPVDIDLVGQEPEGQVWSSRHHAAITFDKGQLWVEDLNSLNGTWVNGAKLHSGRPRPLKPNDVIQIGTVQLKLVIG